MTDRPLTGVQRAADVASEPAEDRPVPFDHEAQPVEAPARSDIDDLDRPSTGVVHSVIGASPARTSPRPPGGTAPEPAVRDAAAAIHPAGPAPEPAPDSAPGIGVTMADAALTPAPAAPAKQPKTPKPPSNRKAARAFTRTHLVRRTVRHIDPWSVLKLSLLFYSSVFLVFLVAGVILWAIASAAGVVGNVEEFFASLVIAKNFHFLGWRILEATVLAGFVLVALASAFTVLLTVFFNLIADIVGGIEITVVEHDADRPAI